MISASNLLVVLLTSFFILAFELIIYLAWREREKLSKIFFPKPVPLTQVHSATPKEILARCPLRVKQAESILHDTDFLKRRDGTKSTNTIDVEGLAVPTCEQDLPSSISISHDLPENSQALADISVYASQFLAKCNPHVGRPGPVCPFVPVSLKHDLLRLIAVNTTAETTEKDIAQLVLWIKSLFMKMEPTSGKLALHKAVILVFPNLVTTQQRNSIDVAQESLKEKFVEDGMMLGEFHRCNAASGLRNENWFPLRTPHPCLAMRFMVPGDIPFLTPAKYEQGKIQRFCKYFLRNFEKDSSVHVEQARLTLEKLQARVVS